MTAQQFLVPEVWDLVLRILAAAAFGGLVGLERELRDQPAGLRTHILVSLGAALFTMAGAFGAAPFLPGAPEPLRYDPTRVAAQVVTGIGFLGAGAIIRHGVNVRGLTTAASMWVTAAIGVATAIGFWSGAIAVTVVTVVSLYGLKRVEGRLLRGRRHGRYEMTVFALPQLQFSQLIATIEAKHGRLAVLKMDTDDSGNRRLDLVLDLPSRVTPESFIDAVTAMDGVVNVEWAR